MLYYGNVGMCRLSLNAPGLAAHLPSVVGEAYQNILDKTETTKKVSVLFHAMASKIIGHVCGNQSVYAQR